MANTAVRLYIRNKSGYGKATKRPVNLPEDSHTERGDLYRGRRSRSCVTMRLPSASENISR